LRTKAQVQVYVGSGIALAAGGTGIVSGLLAAILKDAPVPVDGAAMSVNDGGLTKKDSLALVAAGAALLTLVGAYIGTPSDTLVEHSRRAKHYETIKRLIVTNGSSADINEAAVLCVSTK
jgi:hypothetical protein